MNLPPVGADSRLRCLVIVDSRLRSPRARRGFTLVLTIFVLTVLLALALLTTRTFVSLHHQRRAHERALQADFLVESGLERAVAKLAQSADYQGETWQLSAQDDGLSGDATVTIAIRTQDHSREINVDVLYNTANQPTRASRSLLIPEGERN